jgi:hypothetical protein
MKQEDALRLEALGWLEQADTEDLVELYLECKELNEKKEEVEESLKQLNDTSIDAVQEDVDTVVDFETVLDQNGRNDLNWITYDADDYDYEDYDVSDPFDDDYAVPYEGTGAGVAITTTDRTSDRYIPVQTTNIPFIGYNTIVPNSNRRVYSGNELASLVNELSETITN